MLSINLNTISVSSSNILTTIAKIDGLRTTHRLGRFVISGYNGNGADLTLDTLGLLPTRVFTYATSSPYTATSTTIVVCGALPLDWLEFEADVIDNQRVKLHWTTANEINSDYFEVERRTPRGSYLSIGTVEAKGQNLAAYNYLDTKPPQGRIMYRIRQVDTDGAFSYSNEIEVFLTEDGLPLVSPNPVREQITIQLPAVSQGNASMQLFTVDGKLALEKHWQANGSAPQEISVKGLAEGVYSYQIRVGAKHFFGKVLKSN